MRSHLCLALALTAVVVEATILKENAHIAPSLAPESSKKFFGKDYPGDHHPVADEHYYFDHPYPAVQDSGDFDKDFVKDENGDSGEWKAQIARNAVYVSTSEFHSQRFRMIVNPGVL